VVGCVVEQVVDRSFEGWTITEDGESGVYRCLDLLLVRVDSFHGVLADGVDVDGIGWLGGGVVFEA
jgi:hypothetical protein